MPGIESLSDQRDAPPPGDGIPRRRIGRTASLLGLIVRTAAGAVVLGLRRRLAGADAGDFHVRTAQRYAEMFGQSKGALMKAGQMLSLTLVGPFVSEEFQPVYRAALSRLRDDAPPMAPELARAVVERELGSVEDSFAEFDWRPLAAASVGQVHAARTHDGRAVAVKVQYPGVAEAIAGDLKNAELLAAFVSLGTSCLFPWSLSFDFRGAAREIGARIVEELDYRLEAANQTEFAELYRGHPFIHVPAVVQELSTARVLTQELVRGRSWSEALAASQELRNQWAEAIWRFVYGSNVRFNLLHTDPHPGNFVFHDDGSVSFLDFGCIKRFPDGRGGSLGAIGVPCVEGDVLGTWRVGLELGFYRDSDPVAPEDVFLYWRDSLEMFWAEQPFTVTPEHAARWAERRLTPRGPAANGLRYTTMPPDYTVMGRIELGTMAVIAQLHACVDWRSVGQEYFRDGSPLTAMGRLDRDFFEGRRRLEAHA